MIAPLATSRQTSYIESLLLIREVPASVTEQIANAGGVAHLTIAEASTVISALLVARIVEAPATSPADKIRAEVAEALGKIPKSKYAIPAEHLAGAFHDYSLTNDMLFVEVREYRGTLYMRRLSGAPGSFSRARFTARDLLSVASVIATRHLEYIRAFGEHYTCCGKCGADLTDAASRARFLGPDCARQLGVR